MDVAKMQATSGQHLLHPAAPPAHQHHLPLDYSLGNFKPAIAADFPGSFLTSQQSSSASNSASSAAAAAAASSASLQVRDLSALTAMATIPSPTQLLHQRIQMSADAALGHHQQQPAHNSNPPQPQMPPASTSPHEYAPMSAFKAVLPKKRNSDGKPENHIISFHMR